MLEVGSAGGTESSLELAEHYDLAVALDLSRAELNLLKADGRAGHLVPVWGDAGRLPFPSASFDEVRLLEVLEHVAEPSQVLAECARCLRPGGKFSLSVPTSYSERVYWRLHPSYRAQSTHLRIFRRSEVVELLARAGLSVEHAETQYFAPMIAWFIHSLLRTPADHTGRVLRHRGVDRAVARVVGGLRRLPLGGKVVQSLSSRWGKSWWFTCVKVPSL